MVFLSRTAARAIRSTVLLLLGATLAHPAAVTLNPTVTNVGSGLYQYAYSIAYTGSGDAFLIDISVPNNPGAISNISAPSGFNYQFDSVNGLVSFIENTNTFTASPTSGFSFDSMDAPGMAPFVASIYDSSFNIYTISGSTVAPIPEPRYLYLLGFLAPILIFRRKLGRGENPAKTINRRETFDVANN